MKIYCAHSSLFDYQNEFYEPIKNSDSYILHEFILPHDKQLAPSNSKLVIQACDLFLAEVSFPSIGLGIEMGWAESFKKPIIAIHKKGSNVSSSIKFIARDIYEYESLDIFLQTLEKKMS
jgi:nucleoside 2-deoxyribosyltransferase